MAHFTVLVVTPEKPDPDVLDAALLPFHEYESTGVDAYLEDVDDTDYARTMYEKDWETRIKLASGEIVTQDDFRELPAEEQTQLAETAEEVRVPMTEIRSFADYCVEDLGRPLLREGEPRGDEHAQGYTLVDAKGEVIQVFDRTNPRAKWDWYQIGGRWHGLLTPKPGVADVIVGEPGVFGKTRYSDSGVDSLRRGDLDTDAVAAHKRAARRAAWEVCVEIAKERGLFVSEAELEQKRLAFGVAWRQAMEGERTTEAVEAALGALLPYRDVFLDFLGGRVDLDVASIEDWIENPPPLVTQAILKDGEWHELGEVGWFGSSKNEMSESDWDKRCAELLDATPADHWITVVDCHI